ncbi:hypothetical protein DERF_003369 [Dermatophagoides farinae]|uniref:Uncharacterized protein n=1 Tax=Dermatophagoides farinae TaxID=6954 RepID=A0A922IH51_DERFA|nr:hypothetical protein DERF_003369 [Dermatophagoides farinae]
MSSIVNEKKLIIISCQNQLLYFRRYYVFPNIFYLFMCVCNIKYPNDASHPNIHNISVKLEKKKKVN